MVGCMGRERSSCPCGEEKVARQEGDGGEEDYGLAAGGRVACARHFLSPPSTMHRAHNSATSTHS